MRIQFDGETDWHLTSCLECGQMFLCDDYSETHCEIHEPERRSVKVEVCDPSTPEVNGQGSNTGGSS